MKNKRIVLSLGTTLLVAMPLATVIACDSESTTNDSGYEMTFEDYVATVTLRAASDRFSYMTLDAFYDTMTDGRVTITSQEQADAIKNGLGLQAFNIGTIPKGITINLQVTRSELTNGAKRRYEVILTINGKTAEEVETKTATIYSNNVYTAETQVDFATYTDTVSFRAPDVARKTYQHLDAFVDNNPGEVIIEDQDEADVYVEELGLDVFEIGNKPEDYRITLVLSKVALIPNANKRYSITMNIYGANEDEFFTKTVYIRSTNVYDAAAIADAEAVATVKAAFGTPVSANDKTIEQLDAAVRATITANTLTQEVLSSIGVTATIPTATNDVKFAYSLTKGIMKDGQKVPYEFRIHLNKNDVNDEILTVILSSDSYVAPVTDAEDIAALKAAIGTPTASNSKTISHIESLPTTGNYTFTQFESFGITANVPGDRNGVTLTYRVIPGAKVHNQKVTYDVRLILTKNGTSDYISIPVISSNIYIDPQADQKTVDDLKIAIGDITSANDKTHEQLDAIAKNGSYSAALFTSLGLTGTIPTNLNGATLTYALERSPRNPQFPVDYGFNLYITKGNASAVIVVHIQSSNPYYPPAFDGTEEEQKLAAEKAIFDSIYGTQYNEDAISFLPVVGYHFTTHEIFTREYVETDEDISVDFMVEHLDEFTVKLAVTFSFWGDFDKETIATSEVIVTYRLIMYDVLVEREVDRIDAADEAGVVNTYPDAANTLPSAVTAFANNNFAQFTSSIVADSRFRYRFAINSFDNSTGEIVIEVKINYIGFPDSLNEAYITLRGFKRA